MKDRCSLPFCWRKVWRYMQLSAEGTDLVEHIPYCERHARMADEMFKKGEMNLEYKGKVTYEGIED